MKQTSMKIIFYRYTYLCLLSLLAGCAHIGHKSQAGISQGISHYQQPKSIALLLPLTGPLGMAGQAVRDGVLAAYYAAKQNQLSVPTISFFNTQSTTDVVTLYKQALAQGADLVIGPLDKVSVMRLANSGAIKVPTIALNKLPTGKSAPRDFLQFSLTQIDEAQQIAQHAWQDGKRRALVIVPADPWGAQIGQAFTSSWQALGGTIADTLELHAGQNVNVGIRELLKVGYTEEILEHPIRGKKTRLIPQPRQDADMVFMALPPELARQIKPLLEFYYASNLTVYASSLALSIQPAANDVIDMKDVVICDMPWVTEHTLPYEHASQKNRLYALGMDAYMLSENLARLSTISGISGKTGNLLLGNNNVVKRQLSCLSYNQLQAKPEPSSIILLQDTSAEQPAVDDTNYVEF
jgi:outer membrane PBP1 activator LpoA protein